MKPDLDEELDLGRRLRQAVAGHRPNPPADLDRFIAQVPNAAAASWRDRPRARRGVLGIAIGAAAVLAIVASAALISARNAQQNNSAGPLSSASASGGLTAPFDFETGDWGWYRVTEPAPGIVARVANGYLGECISGGVPAVCTSPDAVKWSLPPDPAVFSVEGLAPFGGWSVAHGASGWVATGTIDPGTWRAADGIHWTAVTVDLPGLQNAVVQAMGSGFVMVAGVYDGQQTVSRLLTSTDGAVWTPIELPAGITGPKVAGAIGLVATKAEQVKGSSVYSLVSSSDGRMWKDLAVAPGIQDVSMSARLSDGSYIAGSGSTTYPFRVRSLLLSDDGLAWHAAPGPGSTVESLAVVDDSVLAMGRIPGLDVTALSESPDGTIWRQIAVLNGNLAGVTAVVSLGDRIGLLAGSKLAFVGTPITGGRVSPTPGATPSPAQTPSEPPSGQEWIIGGWRWHQLAGGPDAGTAIVRIAHGYLGRCGQSMCTSSNGWDWQSPADPAIFDAAGTSGAAALFTPIQVAHYGGAYVILAGEGLWYAPDGVHWQPSAPPPNEPHGFQALVAAPSGFALIGGDFDPGTPGFSIISPSNRSHAHTESRLTSAVVSFSIISPSNRSHVYVSTDGATWTDAGLVGPVLIGYSRSPENEGGLIASRGKGDQYAYSADGRKWVNATTPAGVLISDQPSRLADGSLILLDIDYELLHSTDGRVWTKVKTSVRPSSIAVVGDRLLAVSTSTTDFPLWESTDAGRTFHRLMTGVSDIQQLGEAVLAGTGYGVHFLGTPLSPSEAPNATPNASRLPLSSPPPTPTPTATPAGGISQAEAIRIATNVIHPTPEVAATVRAGASLDPVFGRWVWDVSFTESYEGPLAAQGRSVVIDFYTGEVLSSGMWIS